MSKECGIPCMGRIKRKARWLRFFWFWKRNFEEKTWSRASSKEIPGKICFTGILSLQNFLSHLLLMWLHSSLIIPPAKELVSVDLGHWLSPVIHILQLWCQEMSFGRGCITGKFVVLEKHNTFKSAVEIQWLLKCINTSVPQLHCLRLTLCIANI